MKKFTALMLCLLLLSGLYACAAEKEDPQNPYRVKSCTIEWYSDGELTSTSVSEYAYNEAGYIETVTSTQDDMPALTITNEHDEYGNVIRSVFMEKDGTQSVSEYKLTLDEQHRPTHEEHYSDGTLSATSDMAYDKNGNQTMLNIVRMENGEKDSSSWTDMVYDGNGNLVRQDVRWSDSEGGYSLFEYDGSRRLKETAYSYDDVLNYYVEYSYDETGLVETQLKYDADGTLLRKDIATRDEYDNVLSLETKWYHEHITGKADGDGIDVRYLYTYELVEAAE